MLSSALLLAEPVYEVASAAKRTAWAKCVAGQTDLFANVCFAFAASKIVFQFPIDVRVA